MSNPEVKLEALRRKSGGRVHLTPRVPARGPATTLCGKTLEAGAFEATQDHADCVNCLRRSRDQSRVSGAFFEQDAGSELLRLSLEQARLNRPARSVPTPEPDRKPVLRVISSHTEPKAPVIPDRLGELVTRGFRPAAAGVWRSPGGVVVRMRQTAGRWRYDELVFEGPIVATRTRDGMRIRAGDVEVAPAEGGYEVRIKQV